MQPREETQERLRKPRSLSPSVMPWEALRALQSPAGKLQRGREVEVGGGRGEPGPEPLPGFPKERQGRVRCPAYIISAASKLEGWSLVVRCPALGCLRRRNVAFWAHTPARGGLVLGGSAGTCVTGVVQLGRCPPRGRGWPVSPQQKGF